MYPLPRRAYGVALAFVLAASGCASTVVPSDGTSNGDGLPGTDTRPASDVPIARDTFPGMDTGPMRCEIVGTYGTNGGLIMTLVLAANGTYSADGGRFVGTYSWSGTVLAFNPGPGSASNECASRSGSSVNLTFDGACRQALVVTTIDGCTGGGLLTTSSNLTRQ